MRCPRCQQFCYRLTGDVLSEHKGDSFAPFRNYRERCVYSGGTIADAQQSITPLRRRRMDREK